MGAEFRQALDLRFAIIFSIYNVRDINIIYFDPIVRYGIFHDQAADGPPKASICHESISYLGILDLHSDIALQKVQTILVALSISTCSEGMPYFCSESTSSNKMVGDFPWTATQHQIASIEGF